MIPHLNEHHLLLKVPVETVPYFYDHFYANPDSPAKVLVFGFHLFEAGEARQVRLRLRRIIRRSEVPDSTEYLSPYLGLLGHSRCNYSLDSTANHVLQTGK